jgi:hypothetical protein
MRWALPGLFNTCLITAAVQGLPGLHRLPPFDTSFHPVPATE